LSDVVDYVPGARPGGPGGPLDLRPSLFGLSAGCSHWNNGRRKVRRERTRRPCGIPMPVKRRAAPMTMTRMHCQL